jgi:hypothetical protein
MKYDFSHPHSDQNTGKKIFQSNSLFIPPTKMYPNHKGMSNTVEAFDEESMTEIHFVIGLFYVTLLVNAHNK